MSFLLWVFVYWGSVSRWWVSASRREALLVWSRWLWAILRRVFQSTETYARTFWWEFTAVFLSPAPAFLIFFVLSGGALLLLVYQHALSQCAQLLCIADVHFPGEKPHHCGICGKTFSQSGSRNVHMRKRHGEEGLASDSKETGASYHTLAALGGYVNPGIM